MTSRTGGPGAGTALLELVAIMDRLRTECPWDARQTHESLAPYLLEETYEALEALERRDMAELRGELGDVLLQVLFHACVAAERTDGTGFTIDDVADGIAAKLIRRHPHVFADVTVTGAEDVKRNWDEIKADERAAAAGGARTSALDGVPMGQPALSLAAQLQRRAQRAGAPAGLADLADVADVAGRPGPRVRRPGHRRPGCRRPGDSDAGGFGAGAPEPGGFRGYGPGCGQPDRSGTVRAGREGRRGWSRPRTRTPPRRADLPRPLPPLGAAPRRLIAPTDSDPMDP